MRSLSLRLTGLTTIVISPGSNGSVPVATTIWNTKTATEHIPTSVQLHAPNHIAAQLGGRFQEYTTAVAQVKRVEQEKTDAEGEATAALKARADALERAAAAVQQKVEVEDQLEDAQDLNQDQLNFEERLKGHIDRLKVQIRGLGAVPVI